MYKNITLTISCKGTRTADDVIAYVVQDNKVLEETALKDEKTFKLSTSVDEEKKVYICFSKYKLNPEIEPVDIEDCLSSRLADSHQFGKLFLWYDVILSSRASFIQDMYSTCVIHELNIDRKREFKLKFHGTEESPVYYLTCNEEGAILLHFWDTDVKKDFLYYCITYMFHVIKMLTIAAIVTFIAMLGDIKLLYPLSVIILLSQIVSLVRIIPRVLKEYRHVRNRLSDKKYINARMDDILHIAIYGVKKQFTSLL